MTISTAPAGARHVVYGRELARLIIARCEEAGVGPGGRLPNERNLAAELGVTRTMVRHALTLLEAEGRISREVGRGTFLKPGAVHSEAIRQSVTDVGPADVMAARRLIEPRVLPLVIAWATKRDFDELGRCLRGGGRAQDAAEFEVWDYALHHAIVSASRNQLLVAMYSVVEGARKGEIWGNLKLRNDSPQRRAAYQSEHVRLVEALMARDLDEAVRAMEAHLEHVQANLLDATRQRSPDLIGGPRLDHAPRAAP